jgi:hypothetical protein
VLLGDRIMDPKRHIDQFLSMCIELHLIEYEDVMVRLFLQTSIGPTHEWYMSLPAWSIVSFNDIETMFMTMYVPPITYHTLLTQFTQIHLKKGERIRYFKLRFYKVLNQIPEDQRPNDPIILGCYKNAMLSNVKYSIRDDQINNLYGDMNKETKMEGIMIETNANPNIILGKVQREMTNLTITNQGVLSSNNVEKRGIGRMFQGVIPYVRNDPVTTQETDKRIEITQMNKTIRQMQNELTRLRRVGNIFPPED